MGQRDRDREEPGRDEQERHLRWSRASRARSSSSDSSSGRRPPMMLASAA
jgi:hypothetical protein